MKFSALSLLLLAGSTSAQYFSAGWSPGQKAPASEPEVAPFAPEGDASRHVPGSGDASSTPSADSAKPFSFSNLFDMKNILTSGPAVALFNNFGVNITERVSIANKLWDDRVTLITDDNYQDLIVNEEMTPEEEKERVWVIIVSAQVAKQDEINRYIDNVFDSAFNQSEIAGDIPNVKWGRIDYLNVTYLTTKWGVWRAPYLVIAADRGQSLWFYHHYQLRFREENIRHFLKEKQFLLTPPWSTSFAPGGENEYIMDFVATWTTKLYNVTILIPRWLLLIISGGIGSLLIGLLHKPSKKTKEEPKKVTEEKKRKPDVQIKRQPSQNQPKATEKIKVEEKPAQVPAQPQVKKQTSKEKGKAKEVPPPAPAPASVPAAVPAPAPASSSSTTKPTTPVPPPAKPASPKPAPATPAIVAVKKEPIVPVLPKPGAMTPGTTDSERESPAPPSAKRTGKSKKNNKKA